MKTFLRFSGLSDSISVCWMDGPRLKGIPLDIFRHLWEGLVQI